MFTVIIHTQGLANLDEISFLSICHGEHLAVVELGRYPDRAAECLGIFHAPVGLLNMVSPGDHSVVEHQHGHMIDTGLTNDVSDISCSWSAVGSHANFSKKDVCLGDHA